MTEHYETICSKITNKEFASTTDARFAITSALVKQMITNEEHAELRNVLNRIYP